MSEYSEKLQDPRWQKKRLEILERDGWQCLCCGDETKSLQIHHLVYSKGEPWDAPDDTLETLCRDCHEWREEFNNFCGGRTEVSTLQCYAFCRFSGHVWGKTFQKKKHSGDFLKAFLFYWRFVGPEKYNPDEKKPEAIAAGEA